MANIKTAIVTGASRGIGEATARALIEDGYLVCALCRTKPQNINAEYYECDISDSAAVKSAIDEIILKFRRIDVLVTNSGISHTSLVQETNETDFDNIMNINVKGMFNTVKYASPIMISQKSGKIINISSIWGVSGASCESVYSASKAAVIGFTKALCKELGPSGICVNTICPGVIKTSMLDIYS